MLLAEQYSVTAQLNEEPDFSMESPVKNGRLAKRSFKNKVFIKVLVGVLVLIVANIIFQALVIKQTQEIKVWQGKLSKLERDCVKLRIEMANLESFERIQTAAQKDLGMRVAGPDDYLCIEAAPEQQQNLPQSYGTYTTTTKSTPPGNLWTKLTNWIEGMGETMAQTP